MANRFRNGRADEGAHLIVKKKMTNRREKEARMKKKHAVRMQAGK